jgi:DNA primase
MLEVLLQHPSAFDNAALQRIAAAGLADSGHQQVVQAALRLAAKSDESNWANLLLIELPDELGGLIRELAMAQLPVNSAKDLDKYASGVVRGALLQALSREKTELLAALRRVDPDAKEQLNQIQQQLVELDAERRALM